MDFKNKFILAPMAGFTDVSMRRICSSLGADMTVTEMVSAKAMCYHDKKTAALTRISSEEKAASVQLFGHEPDIVAEAAQMIAEGNFDGCSFENPPAAVDINMGCPMKKIVSVGDGSALMQNVPLAAEIVKKTSRALEKYGIPLTVKIRSGWDNNSVNAPYLASVLADSGAACITVHARTREQMYSPPADLSVIKAVKDAVGENFPIVGNGDVSSGTDAVSMMEKTGCDSVMVGRCALGNFWIFSEIKAAVNKESFSAPSVFQRVDAALLLIRDMIEEKGERRGVSEARGRAAHLIKGLRGAASVRDRINSAITYSEIETILSEAFLKDAPSGG